MSVHIGNAAGVVQETWQAMEKLVDQGLVRSIGISNFSVKKIKVTPEPHNLRKPLACPAGLARLSSCHL